MLTITLPLQRTPRRIASLVAGLMEALFPCGLGRHLVGSTHYGIEGEPEGQPSGWRCPRAH